jgi:glycosyltransferase
MKISIITVCKDSANTIYGTLHSVAQQTYPDIEHIIIDGASIDNTLSVIQRYGTHAKTVVSEPDKGIYDAMNKGLLYANGDIVAFLNADDIYCDSEVLSDVAKAFESNGIDFVYGDLLMVNDKDKVVRNWKSDEITSTGLSGTQIPHPVLFVKRTLLNKIEPSFDSTYKIAADLKQQLILINRLKARGYYIKRSLVYMAIGGASTNGLKSFLVGWRESRRAYNEIFRHGGTIFTIKKVISKFRGLHWTQ